jgi:hypothetical protein
VSCKWIWGEKTGTVVSGTRAFTDYSYRHCENPKPISHRRGVSSSSTQFQSLGSNQASFDYPQCNGNEPGKDTPFNTNPHHAPLILPYSHMRRSQHYHVEIGHSVTYRWHSCTNFGTFEFSCNCSKCTPNYTYREDADISWITHVDPSVSLHEMPSVMLGKCLTRRVVTVWAPWRRERQGETLSRGIRIPQ